MIDKYVSVLFLTGLITLSGCNNIPKPIVPKSNDVAIIEVYQRVTSDKRIAGKQNLTNTIADRETIERVLSFMRTEMDDWFRPWDTSPTPQATVVFKSNEGQELFVLWFGPDWVGGDDIIVDSMAGGIAKISLERLARLKGLLGIKDDLMKK